MAVFLGTYFIYTVMWCKMLRSITNGKLFVNHKSRSEFFTFKDIKLTVWDLVTFLDLWSPPNQLSFVTQHTSFATSYLPSTIKFEASLLETKCKANACSLSSSGDLFTLNRNLTASKTHCETFTYLVQDLQKLAILKCVTEKRISLVTKPL